MVSSRKSLDLRTIRHTGVTRPICKRNRSALHWVIDQYQVSTDKRSGITNDPNRLDDEEYIVRLIKQVITVSLETVQIVNDLPDLGLPND
jgi:hypothetical protein